MQLSKPQLSIWSHGCIESMYFDEETAGSLCFSLVQHLLRTSRQSSAVLNQLTLTQDLLKQVDAAHLAVERAHVLRQPRLARRHGRCDAARVERIGGARILQLGLQKEGGNVASLMSNLFKLGLREERGELDVNSCPAYSGLLLARAQYASVCFGLLPLMVWDRSGKQWCGAGCT